MAGSRYRSAKTGRYVTSKHGKSSSRTTVREAAGKSGNTGGSYRSGISGRFRQTRQEQSEHRRERKVTRHTGGPQSPPVHC